MTEQIAKLLKDFLEEMNDSMLSEFKWYLSQHKEKGSRALQRSQLETSTRTETVDQLVQAFGGDGAVVTAVDVLYRMKLNDLATKLAKGKSLCGRLTQRTSAALWQTEQLRTNDFYLIPSKNRQRRRRAPS